MPRNNFDSNSDSLERIERLLVIEDTLIERIRADCSLSSAEREELIREVEDRIERGDFPEGDDWDGDLQGILVRRLGPKGPQGKFGAAAKSQPEVENQSDEGRFGGLSSFP